jgi:alpha-galactosidase
MRCKSSKIRCQCAWQRYTLRFIFLYLYPMIHFRQALIKIDGRSYPLQPGQPRFYDTFYIDFQKNTSPEGDRYTLYLHPKQALVVQQAELQFDLQISAGGRMLANGFQSASETRFLHPSEGIPRLRRLARARKGRSGDDFFPMIPRGNGYLHSWTYTLLHEPGQPCLMAASLRESSGFSLFLYDAHHQLLTVRKDLEALSLTHSFPLFDIWIGQGSANLLFDRYATLAETSARQAPLLQGYTTQPFVIAEEVILREIQAFGASYKPVTGVQGFIRISEGWQKNTGDWLHIRPEIPGGMAALARAIRAQGLMPALALSPFAVAPQSELARAHPDWLLRGPNAAPLRVAYHEKRGGWLYALDFYQPGVQEYLAGVLHQVLEKWGFDLVYLDDLYLACVQTPSGKTRGQAMFQAMEFLRKCCGKRLLTAAGVPLAAAFGTADYCRTGPDAHTGWDHKLTRWLRHREGAGALSALRSALSRQALNGRFFRSDTGLFTLSEKASPLNATQQHSLLLAQALCGGALQQADAPEQWTPEASAEFQAALELLGLPVLEVLEIQEDVFQIIVEERSGEKTIRTAYCNLSRRPVQLPSGLWLDPQESVFL